MSPTGAPSRGAAATAWSGRVGAGHFFALGVLSMFAPLSIDMYLPALPSMTHSLHTSTSVAQLSITACLVGISAGPLVMGPLSDRFGRRRPLVLGIAGYVVASICCAIAPSIGVLIALRFVQGVAGSSGIVISRAIVRDMRAGNDAARLFALLTLISGATPALAPVLGAALLHLGTWRVVFVALAILGGAIWCSTVFLLPETLPVELRRPGGVVESARGFAGLLSDPVFLGYGLAAGLIQGAMFAYIAASPFVLENIFSLSPQGFSGIFAMNAAGLIAFGQISAALVKRVGARKLMRVGVTNVVVAGVGLYLVAHLAGPLWALCACLFVAVSSNAIVGPNSMAIAMAEYPQRAGSAAALLSLMQFAIGGAVAPLVGLGGSHDDVPMALTILALALGAAAVLGFVTWRERGARHPSAAVRPRPDPSAPAG